MSPMFINPISVIVAVDEHSNKNIRQSFGKLCEVRKGKFYRGKIAYMHFIYFFSYKDFQGNETRVPARNEFIPCVRQRLVHQLYRNCV